MLTLWGVLLVDVLEGMIIGLLASILAGGRQTGLLAAIGEDHVFPTVDAAVRYIEAETGSMVLDAGGRQDD